MKALHADKRPAAEGAPVCNFVKSTKVYEPAFRGPYLYDRNLPFSHTLCSNSIVYIYAFQILFVASTIPTSVVSNSYKPIPARMVAAFNAQMLNFRSLGHPQVGT